MLVREGFVLRFDNIDHQHKFIFPLSLSYVKQHIAKSSDVETKKDTVPCS